MKASNQTPSVRYCVTKCETVTNFRTMNGRCLETNETELPSFSMVQPKITNFFMYMSRDVWNCVGEFTLVAIVTLTISGLIVVLLRFFANIVVWTILCSTILVGFALACYLSYKFSTFDGGFQVFYGVGTLVVVVVTIFIAIFIIFIRHKIKLVIAMFKEAGKAIADLPSLLFLTISVNILSKMGSNPSQKYFWGLLSHFSNFFRRFWLFWQQWQFFLFLSSSLNLRDIFKHFQ